MISFTITKSLDTPLRLGTFTLPCLGTSRHTWGTPEQKQPQIKGKPKVFLGWCGDVVLQFPEETPWKMEMFGKNRMKHRDVGYKLHENGVASGLNMAWSGLAWLKHDLILGEWFHKPFKMGVFLYETTISSEVVWGRYDLHKEIESANTHTDFDQISVYMNI